MKNKRLWILLGGIILASAVFLLLNFRLAVSSTQVSKLLFTTDMGVNMPVSMQQREKISIVLVGEGRQVSALQKALKETIGTAGIGEIDLARELGPATQNPVLIVKVIGPGPIWTPLFAASRYSIHVGYASDGDSTFMDIAEKTHTATSKQDAAYIYAEYDVVDRSFGLISRPGYQQYLADYIVQEIVAALKDLYKA